jgi:hypothetical protein
MPVSQGSCPACGATIEFGLGASLAKVCEHCRSTVLRTDRGLQDLGKVAALADTPSLIAVGDQGNLAGRPFEVLGRVQLDPGTGPWDEYYVAFDHGQAWGWLAYAQGRWHVTQLTRTGAVPSYAELQLESDVLLGELGEFRIAEIGVATVTSAEGELPDASPPGVKRYYADAYGIGGQFATFDYGDGASASSVFLGHVFAEPQLVVQQLGPRSVNRVRTTHLTCPNCGGEIPKLGGERSERLGCAYCGAVSDIAERRVISQQERLLQMPRIPIGSRGSLEGVEYLCLAYVKRSSVFEGETYAWEEFLIFASAVGFRWLINDPETGWLWTQSVSPADLDLVRMPRHVGYLGKRFTLRNNNVARVDYVIGEVYWKCTVGESVEVSDYAHERQLLSRELGPGEVNWSYSVPIRWNVIATAFGLARVEPAQKSTGWVAWTVFLLLAVVIILCIAASMGDETANSDQANPDQTSPSKPSGPSGVVIVGRGTSGSSRSSYRGGGIFSSGK